MDRCGVKLGQWWLFHRADSSKVRQHTPCAVEYALPILERRSHDRANLRRLCRAVSDVREELKGEGLNPNLLLEFASL